MVGGAAAACAYTEQHPDEEKRQALHELRNRLFALFFKAELGKEQLRRRRVSLESAVVTGWEVIAQCAVARRPQPPLRVEAKRSY